MGAQKVLTKLKGGYGKEIIKALVRKQSSVSMLPHRELHGQSRLLGEKLGLPVEKGGV